MVVSPSNIIGALPYAVLGKLKVSSSVRNGVKSLLIIT